MREPESAEAPQAPQKKKKPLRWLRPFGWLLSAISVILITALCTIWWWSGRDDSLANTLERVGRFLPEGQSLQAKEVTGSLRNGGKIGWLQWQSPTMRVAVRDAQLGWSLAPLLSKEVHLGAIHISELELQSTPSGEPKSPTEPLQQLTLPVKIAEVPFEVDRIIWKGPPETIVDGLKGKYAYDGAEHRLNVDNVQWADGKYQAQLRLQGASPMHLEAQLKGDLQVSNPLNKQASDARINVVASVQANGTLATEAARIDVKAEASAQPDASGRRPTEPVQADVQASVMPWKSQPLLTADAKLTNVDVAAFWPQGPRTLLSGELKAGPVTGAADIASEHWQLNTRFDNRLRGPWDKQRLPLDAIEAAVLYTGEQWQIQHAQINVGQGRVEAKGQFTPATQLFDASATVQRLNPADLYSTLDAAPLQGTLSAKTQAAQQVIFDVDLKASAGPVNRKALRIQTLAAKGQWQQPVVTLSSLKVEALQAKVNASALQYNVEQQDGKGNINAEVPGATLTANGQMSPKNGQGQSRLQLSSLPTLMQWLQTLPGVGDPLAGAKVDGKADLALDWNGGWGAMLKRLGAATGDALPDSGLQIKAQLNAEQLRYQAANAPTNESLVIPALKLGVQGSPEKADITLVTTAQRNAPGGVQTVKLDMALQAGLASERGAAALDWQASIQRLQSELNPGKDKPGPWNVKLQGSAPLQLTQRTSGKTVLSTRYTVSKGALQITPPAMKQRRANAEPLPPVALAWDDTTANKAGDGVWSVQSSGRAQGIPLAWVDAFSMGEGDPPLEAAGLSGDLSFNSNWNIDTTGKDLKAQLTVERAAGDLRLAVDDGSNGTTVITTRGPSADNRAGSVRQRTVRGAGMRARIKTARVDVTANGNNVNAKLIWDSERAGTAHADLQTQLTQKDGSWTLAEDAPLSGKLNAQMPDIGIWALFAPPGWRVNGTLQADATISGTRSDPQWQGAINAEQLSILSVLDGIDLQGGVLRTKLQGTRLDITELRIKGGRGSRARILGYSGNLTNAPEDGGELTGTGFAQWTAPSEGKPGGLAMHLVASASKLQVLVRADRQVSVSGPLQARLEDGQFTLRGDITIDRATIILPEESAPSLDKDVVVHTAASRKAAEEEARRQKLATEKANAKAETRKLPDILVKLNMGRDFALQGFGITTRLEGQLEVKGASVPGGPPRITGEINTEQGRYRAWGQSLNVENGLIRFNGPYNNPSLDILAIRPNITQRAGVQVTGTAQNPRVSLYSDPDLPDAEKLSWVVMGRDPALGGAESALLQQAALALLSGGNSGSGKIAGSLGLDEVGFRGPSEGTDASGAALTLGKRLSDKLYLTYEQSLSGAMGTIYIFYDLSRHLTVRGQTGATSAVDLIYTIKKD